AHTRQPRNPAVDPAAGRHSVSHVEREQPVRRVLPFAWKTRRLSRRVAARASGLVSGSRGTRAAGSDPVGRSGIRYFLIRYATKPSAPSTTKRVSVTSAANCDRAPTDIWSVGARSRSHA